MNIRSLHDRVLAKRLAAEDKTSGGLFIPETVKKKLFEALVISVGSGKLLKRGDIRVLIGTYSGSEATLDGEDHIALRENDIHGNLEK